MIWSWLEIEACGEGETMYNDYSNGLKYVKMYGDGLCCL